MTHTALVRSGAVLASVALAAVGLAACSSDSPNPEPAGSETAMDSGEVVTIKYMHRLPDGEGMTKVADIAKRWNDEHPNIQVETTKFDGEASDMIKKLETDVNSGAAPCLAQLAYGEVPEMYAKGTLEDVTAEAEKYKDKFSGAYGQMTVGGVTVGLPQDTGPLVYFYDEAEFNALGLKVPTNLDELKAEAKKAAEQGKYILDFEPDESANWLSGMAAAAGDTWYKAEGDQWVVNTTGEGTKRVADFWQEMIDSKAALTINRWDDAYTQALVDKKLIGNIGAAWEAGFMLDAVVPEGEDGTWKVAMLPEMGAGQLTGPDGGSGVAVMKGCQHIPEAMEFNAWFNSQTKDLATQGLVVAGLGDVVTPEKVARQFGGQDVFAELAKANETLSADFGYIPGFSAVGGKMKEVGGKVPSGEAKVMDIFDTAQQESIAVLKSMNLPVAE